MCRARDVEKQIVPTAAEPLPKSVSWRQISAACANGRKLTVISGQVYDVDAWTQRHPGGKVLLTYTGEDATDACAAFHRDQEMFAKFLKPLWVSTLDASADAKSEEAELVAATHNTPLEKDFRELRANLQAAGLFKANPWFYVGMLAHILVLEYLAWSLLSAPGGASSWWVYGAAVALMVTAQAQAGWLQHDFGHLSVFESRQANLWAHRLIIIHIKGASSAWWNYRHYLHHAKPNISEADPDINMPYVFMMGEKMAAKWAKKQRAGTAPQGMPYQHQHKYWWAFGPPLLLPVYFHYEVVKYLLGNAIWGRSGLWKDTYNTARYKKHGNRFFWEEIAILATFFARWIIMYGPILGGWGVFALYMTVRTIESHWFVWVTQMSHIPMAINKYADTLERDWVSLQLNATCNVEGGYFNDWFTGHLNYQIEHHLFPTMPRHNYSTVAPQVRALLARHGKEKLYLQKPLLRAFGDVVSSLETYGRAWHDAYTEG